MAVPKKRKSKQKTRQVKAGKPSAQFLRSSRCPSCGAPQLPHRACSSCGFYNGRVYSLKANEPSES